eukprot:TRINITY_DN103466_c0_g1_i1.p1 TRINITY_DN103466_c0_g1~~TRINITY_DN103466_c0_g1_i1.p1  ORF type:complete len:429 (+),score=111.29 TRINITY_DN103466_c0_g1_i1:55-1341(+)
MAGDRKAFAEETAALDGLLVKGRRLRARCEDAARRVVVQEIPSADGQVQVRFEDTGCDASVEQKDLAGLMPYEESQETVTGPMSAEEAACIRREVEELLAVGDAQAAAERCSWGMEQLGLGLEGEVQRKVLVLRGPQVWEGIALQAAEAGVSKVRFVRLLEGPNMQQKKKEPHKMNESQAVPKDKQLNSDQIWGAHLGKLGHEQLELQKSRARCWMALGAFQRGVFDCATAAAFCRLLAPPPPKRAPGFQMTIPLLVLSFSVVFARQFLLGAILAAAAFAVDHVAGRRAKAASANPALAEVLALRGRIKLRQGLQGLANAELRAAQDELGPLEPGSEVRRLQAELERAKKGSKEFRRAALAPKDTEKRTWRHDAADKVLAGTFLLAQEKDSIPNKSTFGDVLAEAEEDNQEKLQLGYMDYVGDGFHTM